ncbi:uncharacterized protein LOC122004273 [Zingiber officinale]|uniref:uncharacterized protein LOC122004273 n=1 Tax=Zingiber officinale TaxID=94328 RepID=UPI001C4AA6EF|nr:uncharacterized protein LOC122004273 [Zingiber officinale]
MEHALHIYSDARPIKQQKRDFGADQNKIIKEEVDKLLEVGYIREVQFPSWLTNVVLVSKRVVDSTAGYEFISMLDAYQGYHQIPLAKADQENVIFITAEGTTYQRLMNKVFKKQIGRNIEVYVNDILIKTIRASSLCANIEETCRTLRRYGLKLNPNKSLFGAKSGKFLGYIVTERGIEVNPSKVKALQDMTPPKNLKEAQRLTGRITALSHFISQSANRSLPFFKLSVRLNYRATNNEAEYEAFIAGLQAAKHVGAASVVIHSDSQLVAQQLMSNFGISNERLKLYEEAFDKLKAKFHEVSIKEISRIDNQVADEFVKLASAIEPWNLDRPVEQT